MLDRGDVIFTGDQEALKNSDHPRVRMFLERRPETATYAPEDHFRFIAGD
jgi:ABC-type transporter Mla maintaining outer membrane lipid asymmetry ATPase subunit MlaF